MIGRAVDLGIMQRESLLVPTAHTGRHEVRCLESQILCATAEAIARPYAVLLTPKVVTGIEDRGRCDFKNHLIVLRSSFERIG
jgi:hypothetical protein